MDSDEASPSKFRIFYQIFCRTLTCCLAAGFGGVSDDARAAASTMEGKGAGGKY